MFHNSGNKNLPISSKYGWFDSYYGNGPAYMHERPVQMATIYPVPKLILALAGTNLYIKSY